MALGCVAHTNVTSKINDATASVTDPEELLWVSDIITNLGWAANTAFPKQKQNELFPKNPSKNKEEKSIQAKWPEQE